MESLRMIMVLQTPGNMEVPMMYNFQPNLKFIQKPQDCGSLLVYFPASKPTPDCFIFIFAVGNFRLVVVTVGYILIATYEGSKDQMHLFFLSKIKFLDI
ncbi:unnamed protein product [Moneuplotes crassus]|uniref:Uncharacterized protein n=1 Tax=Euplotes crassus TaxID=5936 RepID=A0AAD1UFG0_EUPCR|nr:unnamed protein product [Moneuplotes crassus]